MRHHFVLASILLALAGCSTPQHIEWHQRPDRILIAPSHSSLSVNIRTDTADRTKQPKIDGSKSYAMKGKTKYELRTADNAYANQFRSNQVTKSLFIVGPISAPAATSGNPQDIPLWESGEWLLHLEFISDPPFGPIDARFRLWTELYVFPFSGMPN